jgi:pimeloyl-ACP methyl ester carboxylesterase
MPESECHLTLSDGSVAYVRHNLLKPEKNNVLFVHGLGESGRCFSEAFEHLPESTFNLLVPDLAGYGRSSSAADYSFDAYCTRLWMVIEELERRRSLSIAELSVVGHSMGGDLATLLCYRDTARRITSFVNVEGDLTKSDVFISQRAVQADESGSFPKWFKDFKELTVLEEWGRQHPECRRYYASLTFAREEAFLANAIELVQRNTTHQSPHGSEIGELYRGPLSSKLGIARVTQKKLSL